MNTGQCGSARRRRSSTKKTRKMRGGNFYSFNGAIGTNGADWGAKENVAADPKTGALLPNDGGEMQAPKLGGRRRRSSRKTKKGGKRRKSRKMRGGASYVSSAGVGAAFKGEGIAGLGNYSAYASKAPAGGPPQGADGVYRA